VPECALPCSSLPGAKDVSASQANRGRQQQHAQSGQQLLFEMAAGLKKGSMKNGIKGKDAQQQGSEFSQFQKHVQFSLPPQTTAV
jgi:hypothetical protein